MPAPLITELPLTNPKANAPGWAYVPQALAPDPSKQKTLLPAGTSRQRGARGGGNNSSGNGFQDAMALNAKADAAAAKRVAGYERENARDVGIAVPARGAGGRATKTKMTPAVRKILGSQKTFSNHLADEEALLSQPAVSRSQQQSAVSSVAPLPVSSGSPLTQAELELESIPTPEVLEKLVNAPPLTYAAARATPPKGSRPPPRKFCAICGYWGRVACTGLRCEARVCGSECLAVHRETCKA